MNITEKLHPFKPVKMLKAFVTDFTPDKYSYKKSILKLRMGKLKPKQAERLSHKLSMAGIEVD